MLQSIKIKNFQSHKESELEFCEGINVIVGTSDAGKSAIIRSILWVLENRPLGSSFIRKGEKNCYVELQVSNTGKVHSIIREKGNKSRYQCGKQEYKAFGNSVPDAVSNMFPIGDVNLHRQLDRHFLVLESGGEIAKVLNETLNIDLIDKCVQHCSKSIRDGEKLLELQRKRKEELEEKLNRFADVDELAVEVQEYVLKEKELDQCVRLDNAVRKHLLEIIDRETQLDKTEHHEEILLDIAGFEAKMSVLNEITETTDELKQLCKDIKQAEEQLSKTKDVDDALRDIEKFEGKVSILANHVEETGELKQLCADVFSAEFRIEGSDDRIKEKEKVVKEATFSYQSALKEMGHCPFCGQKMDEDVCKHLTEDL